MQDQSKIITLGCSVYLIYGIVTFLQSGTFVPPLPLGNILIGIFGVLLTFLNFKKDKRLYLYLLLFSVSYILFSKFFLETTMSYDNRMLYEKEYLPYVKIAQLILLGILFLYLSLQRINNKIQLNIIPLITFIALLIMSLLNIDWGVKAVYGFFALLLFFQIRKEGELGEKLNVYGLRYFFVGFGFIKLMDMVALIG